MQKTTHDSRFLVLKYSFLRVVKTFPKTFAKINIVLSIKRHDLHFPFMLLSNTSTTAHKPRISVLLEPAVVNVPRFQSCHFLGYQSFAQSRVAQTSHKGVTTVHSVKAR